MRNTIMDNQNETRPIDEIVYTMLETLKSNGTFDEFRRHCISDIDAKVLFFLLLLFIIIHLQSNMKL